jgi:hypothetical protein
LFEDRVSGARSLRSNGGDHVPEPDYTEPLRFSEPSAVLARALTKALGACKGMMPPQSERDPDFDARWAAWLARGAAHDRVVRRRFVVLVPVAIVVAVVAYAFLIR